MSKDRIWPGVHVQTPDGPGVTIGTERRRSTVRGPGGKRYVVRLENGRVRRYRREEIERSFPGKNSAPANVPSP